MDNRQQQPSNWSVRAQRAAKHRTPSGLTRMGDVIESAVPGLAQKQFKTPSPICSKCQGSGRLDQDLVFRGERVVSRPVFCTCPEGRYREQDALRQTQELLQEKRVSVYRKLGLEPRQLDFTLESYLRRCHELGIKETPWVDDIRGYLEDYDGHRGLFLHGGTGGGKTGLIVAVLKVLIDREIAQIRDLDRFFSWNVVWTTSINLFRKLRGGFANGSYLETIEELKTCAILALDDLGTERPTDFVGEELMGVINDRYEAQLPMIVSSNFDGAGLIERLKDDRPIWRLLEMSDTVHVNCANLRSLGIKQQSHPVPATTQSRLKVVR